MKILKKVGIIAITVAMAIMINKAPVLAKNIPLFKLNKKNISLNQTKSTVLSVKNLQGKKIKKVTFSSDSKIIKLNKKSKLKRKITAKKTSGSATITIKIKYKQKKIKTKKMYCAVKVLKNTKKSCKPAANKVNNSQSSYSVGTCWHLADGTAVNINDKSLSWKEIYTATNEYGVKPYDIEILNNYSVIEHNSNSYGFYWGDSWESVSFYDKNTFDKMMTQIKFIVKEAGIKDNQTDQEKAFRIFRYFGVYRTKTTTHTLKDFLLNHNGVCDGTCKAYSVVLRYIGLECDYIANRGANHAMNIVKMGDFWYWCDSWNVGLVKSSPDVAKTCFLSYSFLSMIDNIGQTDPFYIRKDWVLNHPFDEYGYVYRCKLSGKPYLTWDELCALPM